MFLCLPTNTDWISFAIVLILRKGEIRKMEKETRKTERVFKNITRYDNMFNLYRNVYLPKQERSNRNRDALPSLSSATMIST